MPTEIQPVSQNQMRLPKSSWKLLQEVLALPQKRVISYGMMFGYPQLQYKAHHLPRRNPLQIAWCQKEILKRLCYPDK